MKKNIIFYESLGFGTLIIFIWAEEIFDLPHNLFGFRETPINWVESVTESFVILALAIPVILLSWRFLKRIKHLESFLLICSFCKRIKVDENWIPVEKYVAEHSTSKFSHGFCPECAKKHYGDILKNDTEKV